MKGKVKKLIEIGEIKGKFIDHHGQDGMTSQQAAKVHGVDISQIVKTLLFIGRKGNKAIVIIQGNKRVNTKQIPSLKKPRLANKKELKELLNTEPGGVPPVGLPQNLPIFVDRGVIDKKEVIGSGGSKFTGLKISPKEITKQPNITILDLHEN